LAGALFGPSASAVTTSKNVDAGVTRGAALTTFTFVNNTGGTLPAGIPISMGQAFRYGDVMPGIYPVIRDAATHVALRGQQWDEISTWRENGGNGGGTPFGRYGSPKTLWAGQAIPSNSCSLGAFTLSPHISLSVPCARVPARTT